MILTAIFEWLILPGGVLAAVLSARANAVVPQIDRRATRQADPPFWLYFLKGCAGFPLLCLALLSLVVFFDRIP
jgi:hypothetical protein